MKQVTDSKINVQMTERSKGTNFKCKPIKRKVPFNQDNPFPNRAYYPKNPTNRFTHLFEKELDGMNTRIIGYHIFNEDLYSEKSENEFLEKMLGEFVGPEYSARDIYIF